MNPDVHCQRDAAIARLTLFNSGKLNAIDGAMWRKLTVLLGTLDADPEVRCVVITGAGGNFAAGGDIEEFLVERDTPARAARYHDEWVGPALAAIGACRHPVIAAIEGHCVGGGLEIAAMCDLRLAADNARFGAPIMKLGFPMHPRELAAVLALAGPATTLEILLEGRLLDAREALIKGLVTRTIPAAEFAAEVEACARRVAAGAPLVARAHKRRVRALWQAVAAEQAADDDPYAFLASHDYAEGIAAFRAKRAPRFIGE